jgi:trimethylamine--corrinoid protein Co-methyltransferase
VAISPEAIAGATAPVTLAGLLAQQNANILAHITLAQIFRPGAPLLYGTVSTIANMRSGTVALGSVETGLITAAAAQMARYYGLPCRSVGASTDSKLEDLQAGLERTATLIPAVLAGVDFVTCGGTLDGTLLESEALLMLDDELCGAILRMQQGIGVEEDALAVDLIEQVGFSGNYLAESHTVRHFRQEHFIPSLLPREPYDIWLRDGAQSALDLAKERVREILAQHEPRDLDPAMVRDLEDYREKVASRALDEFYLHEMQDKQDWQNL